MTDADRLNFAISAWTDDAMYETHPHGAWSRGPIRAGAFQNFPRVRRPRTTPRHLSRSRRRVGSGRILCDTAAARRDQRRSGRHAPGVRGVGIDPKLLSLQRSALAGGLAGSSRMACLMAGLLRSGGGPPIPLFCPAALRRQDWRKPQAITVITAKDPDNSKLAPPTKPQSNRPPTAMRGNTGE